MPTNQLVDITEPTAPPPLRGMLYENCAGLTKTTTTVRRVTVGAVDSGGVGFRLLRVPNA